jgi:hypothetical protein
MQSMYYIGLDVHKKTISYCVKDASGRVSMTSYKPVTNRDKSADSFRVADHSCRIVRTHRTRTTHLVGSGEYPMSSVVVIRIGQRRCLDAS